MNCCVIGIGQFGYSVALQLIENGHEVCVIDKDIAIITEIQDKVSYAMCMEIKDEKSLELINIDKFDSVIIAIENKFESIVIIAGLIKKYYSIPLLICRASFEEQKIILQMIGVQYIILPERESAIQLVDRISIGFGYFYRVSENYSVTYMLPKKSWVGLTIEELQNRFKSITFLGKKNNFNQIEVCYGQDIIIGDEILLCAGFNDDLINKL
jgi:trk system potassium uptake protein TrkA